MNGSGLSSLINGFQQGYTFMEGVNRRSKQDERDDKRFSHEEKQWKREDDYESDVQGLNNKYYPKAEETPRAPLPAAAAGVSPAAMAQPQPVATAMPASPSSPIVSAASAGVPPVPKPKLDQYQSMNNTLQYALERAKIDVKHRKLDGQGLLTMQKAINAMQREGMDEAISLMHQGRFEEAAAKFDGVGESKFGKIVDAKDGVFKQGKTSVPTKIVTVQDANGNTRIIDTAQTMFQQQEIGKVIEQAQKERDVDVREQHGKDSLQVTRDGQKLTHDIAQQQLGISRESLNLQRQNQKNLTPSEQLGQLEAALGRPLTPDEKMTKLGVDKYSQTDRTAIQSLIKSQEQVSTAMFKAQADGTWQADSQGAKTLMEKNAALALKINAITDKYQTEDSKAKKADPLEILKTPMPAPPGSDAKKAAAGIQTAPQQTPANTNGSVSISGDPVLTALAEQMKQLDANDPANMEAVIAIGKARAARLDQLQAKYGRLTKLNQ